MSEKLNVVVLTCDELRGDCVGFMGNLVCRTPNLDRLARRGVVFEWHFTVHGKCVPSRIAMMTGRYAHTDGYRTIFQHLPRGEPNLLSFLRGRGYETAVFGHNHVWEDLFCGEEREKERSDGVAEYHSFVKAFHDLAFGEHAVPEGEGRAVCMIACDGVEYSGRVEEAVRGFSDINRARQAVKYLTEVRDRARPFYLHVNMGSPHPPYCVEEPFFSMYDREVLNEWPHELPRNAPLPLRWMRELRTGPRITERQLREIQAVYYGMVSRVDRDLGIILDCLEQEGLLERSVVVFTSDHGDFAGQYGLIEKWDTCMADCIMRVPLVICAPNLPKGIRVESMSEHTDLVATILELLGMKADWGTHGRSLVPVIYGGERLQAVFADGGHEEEMWRRFNFVSEGQEIDGKQRTYREHPESMARTKMVRTREYKLVMRLAGGNELYNLRDDPWELDNRWGEAGLEEVTRELMQLMIEWCLRTDTDRPYQEKVGA
ncbi:MAG: sulfatase-like hydrolase/transferase [bacterium]|nr:sulfatase-like hydrolase/transferase [bacterium]